MPLNWKIANHRVNGTKNPNNKSIEIRLAISTDHALENDALKRASPFWSWFHTNPVHDRPSVWVQEPYTKAMKVRSGQQSAHLVRYAKLSARYFWGIISLEVFYIPGRWRLYQLDIVVSFFVIYVWVEFNPKEHTKELVLNPLNLY